jgi:CRISPR-associated endonuclease/helicase Cas3
LPFGASLRHVDVDTLSGVTIPLADHPPLWAKLNRNADGRVIAWHSLLDHSADVAAVLEGLLGVPIIAERLGRLAGRPLDSIMVARLSALAFLHDIGKANRAFRARWQGGGVRGSGHIRELHWLLNDDTAIHLQDRLWDALGLEQWRSWFSDDAWPLWDAVFAHHGRPWHQTIPGRAAPFWEPGPDGDPIRDLAVMGGAMPRWFPDAFRPGPALPGAPNFHHAFAGLLMLADWLGSDQSFFAFANGQQKDRMAFARPRAREALAAVGLIVAPVRTRIAKAQLDFVTIFDVSAARPVQEIAPSPEASCVVLEAETGSGKTEAALWRFLHLFRDGKVDGLYFALPSRVAATQVFHRMVQFCDRAFGPDRPAVVLAVPGQQMADRVRGYPLPDFGFGWDDEPNAGERLRRWAAEHPKRFLAAQIAVGDHRPGAAGRDSGAPRTPTWRCAAAPPAGGG